MTLLFPILFIIRSQYQQGLGGIVGGKDMMDLLECLMSRVVAAAQSLQVVAYTLIQAVRGHLEHPEELLVQVMDQVQVEEVTVQAQTEKQLAAMAIMPPLTLVAADQVLMAMALRLMVALAAPAIA